MYVCMYVHMYVCMYVCMYICMYVCMYAVCMYCRTANAKLTTEQREIVRGCTRSGLRVVVNTTNRMWIIIPGSDSLADDPDIESTLPESLDEAALLKMLQSLAQARTADGEDGEDSVFGEDSDESEGGESDFWQNNTKDGGVGRGGSKKRSSARLRKSKASKAGVRKKRKLNGTEATATAAAAATATATQQQ